MWFFRSIIKRILLAFVGLGFLCVNCAGADEIAGLAPAKPTIGSVNCTNATLGAPSCPHMPIPAYNKETAAPPPSVNPWAVVRMFVRKYLVRKDDFDLSTYNPNQLNTSQRGFTVNMTLSYPNTSMNMDMRDLDIKWSVMGGAVKPFNNDNPYAVMRLSYRW